MTGERKENECDRHGNQEVPESAGSVVQCFYQHFKWLPKLSKRIKLEAVD
jgi:hypothetical protein